MARYDIIYTRSARKDLTDILRYIAVTLTEPSTAQRMMSAITKAIASLASMPQKCPSVDDERLVYLGYRKLHIKNYIAFFSIDEKTHTVNVERILYARRDWLHIL